MPLKAIAPLISTPALKAIANPKTESNHPSTLVTSLKAIALLLSQKNIAWLRLVTLVESDPIYCVREAIA